MSLTTNIVLWTISLILASSGILFGILASYNASKANKAIKTILSDSWISDESQNFFFRNIKAISFENKKASRKLKKPISYYEHYINISNTRLAVIPSNVLKNLKKSKYSELTLHYLESKNTLDKKFKLIIKDFSILESDEQIPKDIVDKLIKYHSQVVAQCSEILKKYLLISSKE